MLIDIPPIRKQPICVLHRHPTKVGDKMSAICMASDLALRTLAGILPT
jgi:hypothetical protein